jgi:hypothetical protein
LQYRPTGGLRGSLTYRDKGQKLSTYGGDRGNEALLLSVIMRADFAYRSLSRGAAQVLA